MFETLTLSRFGWNRKPRPRRDRKSQKPWRCARSMRLELLEDRRLLSVEPVSNVFGGSTPFNGASFLDTASEYATSRDGRLVVFTSEADDLVESFPVGDTNLASDVFLYDRLDGTVTLISRSDGLPGITANGASFLPMISDDGLFVAFLSTATDLVPGQTDANGVADLFLYELGADTMSLISHAAGSATTAGDGAVLAATMNADGLRIAFDSLATNLIASQVDTNLGSDVFLWIDNGLPGGLTQLVSRAAGGGAAQAADGASSGAIINGAGTLVLYDSEASNLVSGQVDNNGGADVFLLDVAAQTTILVSGSSGSPTDTANGISHAESVDFVGKYAVITSGADDLATAGPITDNNGDSDVYLFNADLLTMTLVSHAAGAPTQTADQASTSPTISADGRFIAFSSSASDIATGVTDTDGNEDVFLYDRLSGASELVSHAFGQPLVPANGGSTAPELNNDGRFVAFESEATNLVGGAVDGNGVSDIFVLDRGPGVMNLASHVEPLLLTDPPTTGDGASTHPVISANGLSVAFNSDAEELFFGDFNFFPDVFLFSTAAFGTNTSPVLDPAVTPQLTPIPEGTVANPLLGTPVGTAVDAILATPGLYFDLDGTFSKGIAITGQNGTNGAWDYSTDGGATWSPFGIVSDTSAILLSADGAGQNRIRFVATNPDFFGTAPFNFRGWDMTDGFLSGSTGMNVTLNGGNTAYSPQTATGLGVISPVNDPPSFIAGAGQTVLEDSGPQTVVGWATGISAGPANEAGQLLTFVLTPDNPALFSLGPAINAAGTLTFTPAPNAAGVATIEVRLTDNGGTADGGVDTSAAQTLVITIIGVNDAPQPGPNVNVLENSGPQSIPGWMVNGGPDEAGQVVNLVSFSSDHPELFLVQPTLSPDFTLSFTPAPAAFGVATLTVELSDDGGTANGGVDQAVSTREIRIAGVNQAPVFTMGPDVSVAEDSGPFSAPWATGISAGPNEGFQVLTFLVESDHPELFSVQPAIDSATGLLSFTPAPDAFGAATVTVQLVDDGGVENGGVDASAVETFAITIDGAPPAVTVNQAAGQASVAGEGPIHFTAVFSDSVINFDELDLLLGGTAPGLLTATVTQTDTEGMIYDVAVNGMTARGSVTVDVLASAGVDRAGNLSIASTSADNLVFFEPPQTSDDRDPSFSTKGRWLERVGFGGYGGITQVSRNRSAGTTASWTMPVTPGQYNILVTWTAGRQRATNATYTLFDGGSPSAKVAVNQRRSPNDVTFDGAQWENLGTVNVFGDSLTVRLSARANGIVSADAVRIVPVADVGPQIIDNGDLRFTTRGTWRKAATGFQGDVQRNAKGIGADLATWTFLVEPGAEYEVAATWAAMPRVGATNALFKVIGGASRFDARINQRLAPNDFVDAGANWENLGTLAVSGNVLTVSLLDLANGTVAADAIRIQKVTPPGPLAAAQSASALGLDATMAALAAASASPASSPIFPLKSQRDAVDAIFAGPAGPALLL